MDGDQALRSVKNRSFQQALDSQAALQRKADAHTKELLEKQTQEAQFRFLFFSALQFKKNQFFLRMRLLKILRDFLYFRRRKHKLKMIRRLQAINNALYVLKARRKKQEENASLSSTAKPITLFKDLMSTRKVAGSAILKKQLERHSQSKAPRS